MVGKSAEIFGPIVFGELSYLFGSQRPAILSVVVFFIIGQVLVGGVKSDDISDRRSSPQSP
jgi:UMF1 family MFS transporter